MSNRTQLKTLCAAAISLIPVLAHAASEQEGVSACAKALTSQIAGMQGAPVKYSIGSDGDFSAKRLPSQSRFLLDARDSDSQELIASADCTVNWNAEVKKLTLIPTVEDAISQRQEASL